jgi:ubiquinone biosynthesis accessory factor UbiK
MNAVKFFWQGSISEKRASSVPVSKFTINPPFSGTISIQFFEFSAAAPLWCTVLVQYNTTLLGEILANNPFDTIAGKVSDLLNAKGLQNLENPVTQLIRQGLQDMEFVSLEDFEIQREVLNRLREKVHALELRVAELEKRA